jgi:hypothetical protein
MARVYTNFSVWFNGRQVGLCTSADITVSSSGEDVINDSGWDGRSRGNITTEVTLEEMLPVGGDGYGFETNLSQGDLVTVQASPLNGKIANMKLIVNEISYKGDPKVRTTTASVKLRGGPPEYIG